MTVLRFRSLIFSCLLLFMQPLMAKEKDYSQEERAILNCSVNEVIKTLKQEMKENLAFFV